MSINSTNIWIWQPENVLLVSHDKDSDIKLVDFGLAKMLKEGEIIRDMVGTPEFVGTWSVILCQLTSCPNYMSVIFRNTKLIWQFW